MIFSRATTAPASRTSTTSTSTRPQPHRPTPSTATSSRAYELGRDFDKPALRQRAARPSATLRKSRRLPASNVEHVTFCAATTAGANDPSVPVDCHLFAVDGVIVDADRNWLLGRRSDGLPGEVTTPGRALAGLVVTVTNAAGHGGAPQKIPGTMRTIGGAENFARIRSYPQTTARHGHQALPALTMLTSRNPWPPGYP